MSGFDSKYLDTSKIRFTPEGGLAVLFTNETGSIPIKGEVVSASLTTPCAVNKVTKENPNPMGVIYDAEGERDVWIVVNGIADVYFTGSTIKGNIARSYLKADATTDYREGRVLSETLPIESLNIVSEKHFSEIGYVLEDRVGEGLAKVLLHFN